MFWEFGFYYQRTKNEIQLIQNEGINLEKNNFSSGNSLSHFMSCVFVM